MTVQSSVSIAGTDGAARKKMHHHLEHKIMKHVNLATNIKYLNIFKMAGAAVCGLTSPEGEPLAGQGAACVVDSHHPNLVGLVRLQFLQDTVTLLHCHAILLRHNYGQHRPWYKHYIR